MIARTGRRSKIARGRLKLYRKELLQRREVSSQRTRRANYLRVVITESLREMKKSLHKLREELQRASTATTKWGEVLHELKKEKAPPTLPDDMAILRSFSLQVTAVPKTAVSKDMLDKRIIVIDAAPSVFGAFPTDILAQTLQPYLPIAYDVLVNSLDRHDAPFALPCYLSPGDAAAVEGHLAANAIPCHVLDAVLSKEEEELEKNQQTHPLRVPVKNKFGETMRLRIDPARVVHDYNDEGGINKERLRKMEARYGNSLKKMLSEKKNYKKIY